MVAKTGNDRLMVGFNRRFAPLLTKMRADFGPAAASSVTRYLVNAGPLAADSWYRNDELEGSRFAGEGGHFIDTLSWWADSLPEEVYAVARPGTRRRAGHRALRRTAPAARSPTSTVGNVRYQKETLDASGGGRSARLDNFRKATVWTGRRPRHDPARGGQDKGQRAQVARFVEAVPDRRPDADLARVPGRHDRGHDRGAATACSAVSRSACERARTSRLGWYARRLARMSPAEVAWRAA